MLPKFLKWLWAKPKQPEKEVFVVVPRHIMADEHAAEYDRLHALRLAEFHERLRQEGHYGR